MTTEQSDIEVGCAMADILVEWRPGPEIADGDIAGAIMHALERYSITLEGPREAGLASCFFELERMIEERRRSI